LIKKHIPNFVTLLNLLSGCVSIIFAFNGHLALAAWFIGLAAIFDFLDGTLARLLNARSPIGLQLDSLADVISFGVAPGFIVFHLIQNSAGFHFLLLSDISLVSFAAFLIPAFSALRLAKFNIDDRQTDSFIGLPTPANALFFASLPLVYLQAANAGHQAIVNLLQNIPLLLIITVICSLLLVAPIPLLAFKFKTYSLPDNLLRYVFILTALILFFTIKFYAVPLLIVLYVLISLFSQKQKPHQERKNQSEI
jgi:CDP-diacylglycerol---serine O-phosphatidyltransferase